MQDISKLFFLAFLLNCILSLQTGLNADEKVPIEIKIGTKVEYDQNKNYFTFSYSGSTDAVIIIDFIKSYGEIYLTNPNKERNKLKNYNGFYPSNLTYEGIYFIEIQCAYIYCEMGSKFKTSIYGNIKETIDLSKNIYFHDFNIFYINNFYGNIKYKVSGLKENKWVYFRYLYDYDDSYYYPYDPNDPINPVDPYNPDFSNLTIFEVFNINSGNTAKNVNLFQFKQNNEYIITIRCLKYYDYYHSYDQYLYPPYIFIPITNSTIKKITGNEGIISSDGPIYGVVESNNEKEFYMYFEKMFERHYLYFAKTDKKIENDLEILQTLQFNESNVIHFSKGESENTVFFLIPQGYDSKVKLFLVDEVDNECKSSYSIPANKNKIIYCQGGVGFFNSVLTYSSQYKNMRFIISEDNENSDYLIKNYFNFPIYVDKTNNECTISTKNYTAKFAHFGAENPFLFNSFYKFFKRYANEIEAINIDNYVKLTQMNLRINSRYLPFFEFYNAYFNQLDIKVNVFLRQLYGGTDIYECDASGYDIHNLEFLTTPISNAKCKNRKSILNRLYSFDGTKIISGYITHDSYFDIYIEIKDDSNKVINLNPISENDLMTRNNAKYLKKDVDYKINFNLNHLIKLDPEFNAEIKITNGQTTTTINSQNPTTEINGSGYTIKSNTDAMVYFIGRLPPGFAQLEIDTENSKGKIIKISGVDPEISDEELRIDLGFQNYCPSDIPIGFRKRDSGVLYLDNIYERLKVKLVKGEKLYIYSNTEQIRKLNIEYIGKNLNNKNNDYNIFLIPNNNEDNTLIINTDEANVIFTDIYFCKNDTTLKISHFGRDSEKEITITNDDFTKYMRAFELYRSDNKMTFKTNQPVVFTYLFWDVIDDDVYDEIEDFRRERVVLNDSTIEEIGDKNNNDNVIKIKFKPNYKQSSTRYIMIIAQKTGDNTLDNFKDPCYITGLLNQRPNGVKVETIYDVGDNDSINAEVDISDILTKSNNYLMNIISQELRFDKKINFYEPKEFNHVGKEKKGGDEGDGDDEGGLKGTSLVLAIVLPIVGAIIIALVIIFICRRKSSSSRDIEKLTQLTS